MGIITKKIQVTLTVDEVRKLDDLRLIFGTRVSRNGAIVKLINDRYRLAVDPEYRKKHNADS